MVTGHSLKSQWRLPDSILKCLFFLSLGINSAGLHGNSEVSIHPIGSSRCVSGRVQLQQHPQKLQFPICCRKQSLLLHRQCSPRVFAQPLQGLCEVQWPCTDARRAGTQPSFAFQVIAVDISFSLPIIPRKWLSIFIHAPAITSFSAFGWATLKHNERSS